MNPESVSSFLTALYLQCLKRVPDESGRVLFQGLIATEGWSYEQVATAIMDSEEYRGIHAPDSPVRVPPSDPLQRVCFIHLEKTAGTSFHDYLLELYRPEHVFPERLDRVWEYSWDLHPLYRLYSGHYSLCNCEALPKDTRYITFLRRPDERILSLYYFWRSLRGASDLVHVNIARTQSLADFLRHPETQDSIREVQVRRLVPLGAPATAEVACQTLEAFASVGVKELYSLSVLLLARTFDWPLPSKVYRRLSADEMREHPNHEPVEREPASSEVATLLAELTEQESVVYEYAVKRVAREVRTVFGAELNVDSLLTPVNC